MNLKEQQKNIKQELLDAVADVLDESYFILGEDVKEFEKRFAGYCGTEYAVGVNSGTDALTLSLKALGVGPGDEVITVSNSFLATASCIAAVGAKPVFVDVLEDMNMNPELIGDAVTGNTKAIIPVHLTGRPARMDAIKDAAEDHGLFIVEDAAQAVGAEYKGERVGSFGVGCFSLHPLKNLNACGDAGIITTDDEEIFAKLTQLRNIGLKDRNHADVWGYNSRLDTVQAAILNVKFKYLDKWTEKRRENARYYCQQLEDVVDYVPAEKDGEKCVYHTYVIQTDRRDELQKRLGEKGIGSKIHYPIPIHLQKAAEYLGYGKGSLPVTEEQYKKILSLPIYPELTGEQLEYVAAEIKTFMT